MSRTGNLKSTTIARGFSACILGLVFGLLAVPAYGQSHIHQLWYNNSGWGDTDWTAESINGPEVAYDTGLAALYTQADPVLHVYYVGVDDHIHQLYYNGTGYPADVDLTKWIPGGGEDAFYPTGVSAFQINGNQYVYFCGADGFIHEYSQVSDGGWGDSNMQKAGACGSVPIGIVAFATSDNQRHVFYDYASGRPYTYYLHELWYNPSTLTWTSGAFGEKMSVASWISGFAGGTSGTNQYVFFTGLNQHLYMESYVNGWALTDLTVAAGNPPLACGGIGTAAFAPGTTQMEVYYAAFNSADSCDVHQMTFLNNQWTDLDVTAQAGGYGPSVTSQMVAFPTPGNSHVYLNEDEYVYQLYYNGTDWFNQELSSVEAYWENGMAGFAIGNEQYLYYVSLP